MSYDPFSELNFGGPDEDMMVDVYVGKEGGKSLYFGKVPIIFADDIFPPGRRVFLEDREGDDFEGLVQEASIVVTHVGSHVQVIVE